MISGFRSQCVPSYRILTQAQIREIHLATLEVLETVGVRVLCDEGVELLSDAGCRVGRDQVVRIPNWLVEECIRSAPSRITVYNRLGQEAMRLEGRNIHFGTGTDLINTWDLSTGELRESRLEDAVNAARVADYCDQIDFVANFASPQDVAPNLRYLKCFQAVAENTVKPIFFTAAGQEDLAYILEIAAAIVGGEDLLRQRPFVIHYSEPTAPLTHSYGAVRKLLLSAEKGIPVTYTPGDILGASAPVTLAGGIVQANAEALSGIVLHQLKAKGSPIISGLAVVPLDMLTATFPYGAPEWRLTNSAFADLYHYYEIPMWSTVGSDAHTFDEQAALEHGITTLMAALDGANLIHDVGYMGQGLVGNPAMIVMGNEIISYTKRIVRGLDLDREHMAVDLIRKAGPGGNYLTDEHTRKHFRQELWRPSLLNRHDVHSWVSKGMKTYGQAVAEKAREILSTHVPQPLSDEIRVTVGRIVDDAQKALERHRFVA